MQEHRVERERHALALGGMQRDDRLAVAVMAGLDAREQQRRVAERPARAFGVVGLAEVRFRDGVLMLKAEERLARLGVRLRADARARFLGELDEQRPEQLHEAPCKREAQLHRLAGRDQHDQAVLLGVVLDLKLVQLHGTMVPLMRAMSAVVERSCSKGMETTRPPRARTPAAPTMRSTGQSPPFASTSGRHAAISRSGVSSSNQLTALTASSAATTARRSASALIGRSAPLPRRRADASLLSATSRLAPSARARARYVTWPRCSTSKTPFVKTSGRSSAPSQSSERGSRIFASTPGTTWPASSSPGSGTARR